MEFALLYILFGFAVSTGVVEVNVARGEVESGKRVSVNINWSCEKSIDHYMVMKRRSGEDWRTISVFDFADGEPIRVLNAFPGLHPNVSNGLIVDVTYADGSSTRIEKSSALKIWMEGGFIEGKEFENAGRNPVTGDQFILVDLVRIEDLNSEPTLIWNYDIVVFGTWDAAGRLGITDQPNHPYYKNLFNVPSDKLGDEVRNYAAAGYGVIASHDTMGAVTGTAIGLGRIRDIFGVKVRDWDSIYGSAGSDEGLENCSWYIKSEYVSFVKYGDVVDFPWSLSRRNFDIALTHTVNNMATSDVWIELTNYTETTPYTGPPGIGNVYYYLTTKNNTAMIQTGHSACNSTLDERKIWANLIRYLKHRTNRTVRVDHSPVDEDPPTAPVCECCVGTNDEYIDIHCSSEDSTVYEYRVEGYDNNNLLQAESKTVVVDVGSVGEYYILGMKTGTPSARDIITSGVKSADGYFRLSEISNVEHWFSVAVDLHGNISPVTKFTRDTCRCPTDHMNVYTRNARRMRTFVDFFLYISISS